MALADDFATELTTLTRKYGIVMETTPDGWLVGRAIKRSPMGVYYGVGEPIFRVGWRSNEAKYVLHSLLTNKAAEDK